MGYRDQLDEKFAEGWKPDAGDEIMGVVETLSTREGKWGAYPIVTVRVAEGDEGAEKLTGERRAIHGNARALQGQIEEKDPQRGDFVICRFDGQKVSKAGNDYAAYSLVVLQAGSSDFPASLAGPLPPADDDDDDGKDEEPF
jgi:hypothetical protein